MRRKNDFKTNCLGTIFIQYKYNTNIRLSIYMCTINNLLVINSIVQYT